MADAAKKKPGLALVIGVGKGKPAKAEPDGDESYDAAIDELFDAVKSGNKQAFRDASEAAVMSCK